MLITIVKRYIKTLTLSKLFDNIIVSSFISGIFLVIYLFAQFILQAGSTYSASEEHWTTLPGLFIYENFLLQDI